VLLLGDPSGAVHVLAPGAAGTAALPGMPAAGVQTVAGVTALPGGTFAVLP
jgi:hypothetical protein